MKTWKSWLGQEPALTAHLAQPDTALQFGGISLDITTSPKNLGQHSCTTKVPAQAKPLLRATQKAALTPPAGMPRYDPPLAWPRHTGVGAHWGSQERRLAHHSPRQIISYLQPLPPRRSPLTSFTQARRLEPTAADVWLLSTARHIGTPARLAPPPPKKPFYNPNLGAPHTETSCFLHRSAAAAIRNKACEGKKGVWAWVGQFNLF